jgi:hypothetical protein
MKKEEMVSLLRSAGVDENAVNLAINAWEMGAECERQDCLKIVESYDNGLERNYAENIAVAINARGNK